MSSDEEDYMSDKYLFKESEDVRPGLPKRKTDQRAFEQYKKRLKSTIPNKNEQEVLKRDEGLNTAIASTNKGFQMLAKMGYKTGTSLGSSNTGIVEPISINLKSDKGGLGKKSKTNSIKTPKIEVTKEMEEEYRRGVQDKKNMQMIRKFYYKAQTCCMNLDHQNHVNLPVKDFYWPRKLVDKMKKKNKKKSTTKDDEEYDSEERSDNEEEQDLEEEEEEINEELLKEIVGHLRVNYFYCVYCAAKAADQEDLDSFCPGESYDDHDMD
ncbi:G patch domain-containing protein 11 [Atheta coriaria]|uniref:G patch domain-containing protein 11 n=1 Tax=Dalotia coriaria TaxID=877792 RepID=UPI0031F3D8BA